jgi:exodeoxyribonuclease VII small subunit
MSETSPVPETSSVPEAPSASETSPVPKADFGASLAELERIVTQLESGQLELEESLARYEQGVKLIRELKGTLADAEQKVTTLLGEIEPESLDDTQSHLDEKVEEA